MPQCARRRESAWRHFAFCSRTAPTTPCVRALVGACRQLAIAISRNALIPLQSTAAQATKRISRFTECLGGRLRVPGTKEGQDGVSTNVKPRALADAYLAVYGSVTIGGQLCRLDSERTTTGRQLNTFKTFINCGRRVELKIILGLDNRFVLYGITCLAFSAGGLNAISIRGTQSDEAEITRRWVRSAHNRKSGWKHK